MESLIVILDPAHGSDTPGKCAPDGSHREYLWSREICHMLEKELGRYGFLVHWTNKGETEIGLRARVKVANEISGSRKLMLSMHNNAAGMGKWMNARGVCIFTTPGKTKSDACAEIIMNDLMKAFPELKFRMDTTDGDKDIEANFTVLTGTGYWAVLLEWLFQDNQDDLFLIKDTRYKNKLIATLVQSIIRIDKEVV